MHKLHLFLLTLLKKLSKSRRYFPNYKTKKLKTSRKLSVANMTTKGLSRKQIIVPINLENTKKFIKDTNSHVTNINRALKNIKLDIAADFIQLDNKEVIITTNKIASTLDLQTIERYIININNIESNQVEAPRLPQLKSYLKIIGIPYFLEDANSPITTNMVEKIIKDNHIFNNIVLVLKLRVIKVLSKSNMSIIWFDIWNVQSSSRAKDLINICFNIGNYTTTIQDTNMNLKVLQCKNYWKWEYMTGACRIQGAKYVKYNSPHKLEHQIRFKPMPLLVASI